MNEYRVTVMYTSILESFYTECSVTGVHRGNPLYQQVPLTSNACMHE